jgi:hypothetical protein
VKLLTGNVARTGEVIWWAGDRWSPDVGEAVLLEAVDGAALLAREAVAEAVNDLALVDAEVGPDGRPRPCHVRERIRAFGPTVRPDLGRAGRDWR